jgi:S-ribosylhomocysteine lyase
MKKIESFQVNHEKLNRGIYVSRKDSVGDSIVTTFDIRMKLPNREPVINTGELHAIEHLGATFLRNHPRYEKETIYFGPMGCRTGFYLILKGDLSSKEAFPIISEMFEFISSYTGEIPGADPISCGNYTDMNLAMAKYEANKFINETLINISDENFIYPK